MKEIKFILLFLFTGTFVYGQHPKPIYPEFAWEIVNLKVNKRNITFNFQTNITVGWKLILDNKNLDWGVSISQGKEFLKDEMIKEIKVVQKVGNKIFDMIDESEIRSSTGFVVFSAELEMIDEYDFIDINIGYMRMNPDVIIPSNHTIRINLTSNK